MTIIEHYAGEKSRYLENCTQCGLCAKGCPILPYTDVSEMTSRDIQKGVYDFMNTGIPNHPARTKAFACMECFKCTAGMCPEGLNPLLVNELIKGDYISKGLANKPYGDPKQPNSVHQVSGPEYKRITTSRDKGKARFGFSVINYVSLVAEAMGIRRDDKFKQYTLWGNLDRILKDANDLMAASPFGREYIIEVLENVFVG